MQERHVECQLGNSLLSNFSLLHLPPNLNAAVNLVRIDWCRRNVASVGPSSQLLCFSSGVVSR